MYGRSLAGGIPSIFRKLVLTDTFYSVTCRENNFESTGYVSISWHSYFFSLYFMVADALIFNSDIHA